MPTCFVRGCSNSHTKKRPDVTFHLIPKNSKTQWLSAIGRAPNIFVIQQRVCSEHFEEYDFERIGILRKIKPNVIPTKNLPKATEDHTPLSLPRPSSPHDISLSSESTSFCLSTTSGRGLLHNISNLKSCELTAMTKRMYQQAVYYKRIAGALNRKKLNLTEKLNFLEKILKKKSFLNLTKNCNNAVFQIFKRQAECFKETAKGRSFSLGDTILGLALYKQNPAAYQLLSKIFGLPSCATLQKILSRIPIVPGIHDAIFSTLQAASRNMKPEDRCCVLLFDEMTIKANEHHNEFSDEVNGLENFGTIKIEKITNSVQVYMLRGIVGNWKQPVGYVFGNERVEASQIRHNIVEVVRKAKAAGLTVLATVCDQSNNNKSAINSLVSETQNKTGTPHYVFDIDDNRIVPLFDVPHLLKALRNILLNREIHFINKDGKEMVAKWENIQKIWYLDNNSGDLRAIPKLTEFHVMKFKIKKMNVSLAAQVFSRSVAAIMNLLITNNKLCGDKKTFLNEEAYGTVVFLKTLDDTFDSLNGSAKIDITDKPLRTAALTEDNSIHEGHWDKVLPFFESMYVLENGHKKTMPCFKSWQITLNGFKLLRTKLKSIGFIRMKTRMFNQDPLGNYFSWICQQHRRSVKPTSSEFEALYKSSLVNELVYKHSVGFNCEADESDILVTLEKFIT